MWWGGGGGGGGGCVRNFHDGEYTLCGGGGYFFHTGFMLGYDLN